MKILNEIPPEAHKDQPVSIDIEMFEQEKAHLHRPGGRFGCISITMDGKTVYQLYDEHDVKKALQAVKKGMWIFHNALYDLRQLRRWAEIKPRFIWDTMLVDQSMYGGYYQNFALDDLSRRWLGEYMEKGTREEFSTYKEFSPSMKTYAAKDAVKTLEIAALQKEAFDEDPSFKAYTLIDEPMIFPVLDMQGMRVDVGKWTEAVQEFERKGKEIEAELGINTYSQQQVIAAVAKQGIHLMDNQATTLDAFKKNTFVAKIIEAKMYRKATSTYGLKWLEKYVESDGKVYPSWHITGAETGRMSSSNPNGQNIPARKMPIYRTFFIASPEHVMLISDASAQEPCVLAHESGDEALLKILQSGQSVHMMVAREIFNDPSIKSKEDDRYKVGKTINLGTSYGLSEYGLATRLNITEQEAAKFLQQYFNRFKDVFNWIGMKRQEALSRGYIKTASGRRVYINPYDNQWKNNAINSPIQGGAADQTKRWVRLFWEASREADLPFTLTAIIHDETTKEVPKKMVKEILELNDATFKAAADNLFPGIPFRVETEKGKSWAAKQMESELYDEEDEE